MRKGKVLTIHIWDSSGAEECRTLRKNYYPGTDRVWIVYDVTDRRSFQTVRSWYREFEESGSTAAVFLLANKCDLLDGRVIAEQEGAGIATELGMKYREVSAKSNVGVEALRGYLPSFE
ncbi:GTP-binding protein [Tulasnella sp. JGI-2019a]|nr:GTP-binding protein [Tulasnella sp. JGI-2019a]KAG8998247.1 GTP-binding protein [Tulasnella sp. JGI-2019a]